MFSFLKRLWNGETDGLTAAAFLVGAASFASRIFGIFRDRILASSFGAGDLLDAYYTAFRIPDTLYNLIIIGALSAGFIPVFTEWYEQKGKEEAFRLAEKVLSVILTSLLIAVAVLFVAAPVLVPFIAPGFEGDKLETTIWLTRLMLLSPVFLGVSAVMGGILQSRRRFFAFSLAPVLYNIGIIFGAWFLAPYFGVYGVGIGVILGAFLHFITQSSVAFSLGLKRLPRPNFKDPGIRKIVKLMIPRTLGLAVTQLNLIVILALASTLGAGSVAVFQLAQNLQSFPLGLFGISFAIAAFPLMAEAAGRKDDAAYTDALNNASRKIFFLMIPTMALFILLRAQIVRIILGQGFFDWDDTIRTANVLGMFALSLFAQGLIPLFMRAYYAVQEVKTPILITAGAEIMSIILAFILKGPYGVTGLAIAFSVSAVVQITLLIIFLRKKKGPLGEGEFGLSAMKIIAATFALCLVAYPIRQLVGTLYPLHTFFQVFMQALLTALGGAIIFFIVAWMLHSPELEEMAYAVKRRLWRKVDLSEGVEEAKETR